MKASTLFLFVTCIATSVASVEAPAGCLKLPADKDWPTDAIWKAALPGVIPGGDGNPGPNYRIQAKTVKDVQKAVKFASQYNIRLSIITTGHDQNGRSNLGSGLLIDMSKIDGIAVAESYAPTAQGMPTPKSNKGNVITPKPDAQAVITIGPGMAVQPANNVLAKSNLMAIGGTHGSIAFIGGWGQSGGYGPLTAQYGLGTDQWLEAKVVTADGNLVVTNEKTNPDLLWALRGGGGGTFGVVVQATLKVYPNIPITAFNWYINSTAPISTPEQAAKGIHPTSEALKYLMGELPELQKRNVSAYFYVRPDNVRVFAVHPGNASGVHNANAVWGPILDKMSSFPGMTKYQTKPYDFKNFQEFWDVTYGKMGDDGGVMHAIPGMKHKRHGPSGAELPRWRGVFGYDSRLLAARHLRDPNIMQTISSTRGSFGMLLCAPGAALGPMTETSVLPAWRDAVIHFVGYRDDKMGMNIDALRKVTPEMGSYINEGHWQEKNWTQSFWGANYPRLSKIKTKYDPNMLFWATPGIEADRMKVVDGRVCKAAEYQEGKPSLVPPQNEKTFPIDMNKDREFVFGELELIGTRFPAAGSMLGLQTTSTPFHT